ncbi:hypothetical protein CC1G_00202 [Coprinopsis cinerea okayama7|uniref:Uncharacterized protein n=1 Tax=Coprinopsis cinerea (strain Okayama-7 / 130 / ATCC MYA-4618 / FGSC 9003) TaxID=240176 RepID=A8NX48_COPC7|nr:hypothetical protein CC1G_00202 [Coprinopsis cinerea okayama7\|eukprot:XP_001837066.1 hypothetical protein CC1G_00202 [Coprinopsis cinerea okayama7\
MKSFFKTWKRKDKDSPKSPKPISSQISSVDSDHGHRRLVVPDSSHWSSASPTPSSQSSSSSVSASHPLSRRTEVSASSSKDAFVEDALHYRKTPDRSSPDHPSRYPSHSHHPYGDLPRVALLPPFISRHGAPQNNVHGPPRNAKHGPPNVLQAQLSSINAAKKGDVGTRSPHPNQPSTFLGQLSPHRQGADALPEPPNQRTRTPTRVKFDSSVEVLATRTSRVSLTERRPPQIHSSKVKCNNNQASHSVSKHAGSGRVDDQRPSNGRPQRSDEDETSNSTEQATTTPPKGLKLYHSSQSSPHLPARVERRPPEQEDLCALFPSPPPLIIRKKVPQPLVLQPRSPPSTVAFPPSPNPSSTDSTPVSTPTSPKQFPTSTPTQSPLLKASFVRHGNAVPPPLYDPPTSPLPSPPVNPQSTAYVPRKPTYSLQGRAHLRGTMSTSSLRGAGGSNHPTHRMTSSDPMAEVLQQLTKSKPPRASESSRSSPDPPVQWGYAL